MLFQKLPVNLLYQLNVILFLCENTAVGFKQFLNILCVCVCYMDCTYYRLCLTKRFACEGSLTPLQVCSTYENGFCVSVCVSNFFVYWI